MSTPLSKRYSELSRLHTFEDRFDYLKLGGSVGESTFGFDRYINQDFYRTAAWRSARREVILRDRGCDLGIEGREIHVDLLVHHMNPMSCSAQSGAKATACLASQTPPAKAKNAAKPQITSPSSVIAERGAGLP